jgi:hypothetical protein
MDRQVDQALAAVRGVCDQAVGMFKAAVVPAYERAHDAGTVAVLEYVAKLDQARKEALRLAQGQNTSPPGSGSPRPPSRWPDDDGPYRKGSGGASELQLLLDRIETADAASNVEFVAVVAAAAEYGRPLVRQHLPEIIEAFTADVRHVPDGMWVHHLRDADEAIKAKLIGLYQRRTEILDRQIEELGYWKAEIEAEPQMIYGDGAGAVTYGEWYERDPRWMAADAT